MFCFLWVAVLFLLHTLTLCEAQSQQGVTETVKIDSLKEEWKSKMQLQLMEEIALEGIIDPEQYVLGPGDEVIINIWGDVSAGFEFLIPPRSAVTPEGKILIPTIGDISVGDQTLAQASKAIAREVKKKFRNVTVTVNLGKLRKFRVFVLGEVSIPGTYVAKAIDRISALVERAGGFTPKSSTRKIEIRRGEHEILSADLVLFNWTGNLEYNPYVLEGDVIFVPVKLDSVSISGAVNLPGDYEYKEGDTLKDLIKIAGGLSSGAYLTKAEIVRFLPDGLTTEHLTIDLDTLLGQDNPDGHFALQKDDQVFIRSKPEWRIRRTVTLEGEVRYPGEYAIDKDNTNLSEIIEKAGGFTVDASLDEAKVIRQIYTEIVDPEYERLRRMSVADMTAEEREYFKTKSREQPGIVVVDFERLFNDRDVSQDIVLKPMDIITIPKVRNTVTVSGAVDNPGSIIYKAKGSVDYYIDQAGGYTKEARKSKVRLIKGDTGVWLRPDEVNEIKPGDTVWVPEKPDRDWWALFRDFMWVSAQIATVAIVIKQIAY
ncbi:MAG: SLBB domain-containing protein [Gemmatimonadota bacterium]|nr:MAG: SLBB domain-containing protein [Gemmatimonadota bacterium]